MPWHPPLPHSPLRHSRREFRLTQPPLLRRVRPRMFLPTPPTLPRRIPSTKQAATPSRQTLSAAPPENEVRDPDRDRPSGGQSTAPPDSRDHSPQTVPTAEPTSAAGSAQDTPPEEPGHDKALRPAQAAVWDAVGSGRLGLAYQIALADQTVEGRVDQPSPELLAAVALGTVVRGPDDDVADEFGRRLGDLTGCLDFGNVEQSIGDALNLLLFAASLFPALFASRPGGSIPLLRCVQLSDGLTPVFRLAGAVAKHAKELQTIRLDLPTLTAILDEGAWKDRIAKHADEVARWKSSTTFAKFLYAPAGAVWKHWLRDGGILAELDRLLSTDEAAHVERVRQIVDQLADKRSVDDLIKNTDRKEIGRRGQRITGRALSQFQSRLAEPLALARAWLRLIEAKPGGAGFVEGIVEQLHRDINLRYSRTDVSRGILGVGGPLATRESESGAVPRAKNRRFWS